MFKDSYNLNVKRRFKIHALTTVDGNNRSADNGTFYETKEEAMIKAKSYVENDSGPMVVYAAVALLEPVPAPIRITHLEIFNE